jgi:hypothetical protein
MKNTSPTPAQVRAFLKAHGLTGSRAAELAGLSGSAQVRKYTGGENPHRMSYAIQFTLAAKCVLDADTIARIEAAMPVNLPDG